jgi:hypothetical protein
MLTWLSRPQSSSANMGARLSFGCELLLLPSRRRANAFCALSLTEHGSTRAFDILLYYICSDKVCIDQDNISRALRCLPVFVLSCNRILILAGDTYCERLWCVWCVFGEHSPVAFECARACVHDDVSSNSSNDAIHYAESQDLLLRTHRTSVSAAQGAIRLFQHERSERAQKCGARGFQQHRHVLPARF